MFNFFMVLCAIGTQVFAPFSSAFGSRFFGFLYRQIFFDGLALKKSVATQQPIYFDLR